MKSTLVGYTGFVGSNLAAQHAFDALYNSKNIQEGFERPHELVVYSGVRAEKFLANANPDLDLAEIEKAKLNIERLRPKKLVLVSTIDVYKSPVDVSESSPMATTDLHPYGLNRLLLEDWVRSTVPDHCIVRLPALFGTNLKKNFLFDMIRLVPSMLKTEVWDKIRQDSPLVETSYLPAANGFHKLVELEPQRFLELRTFFASHGFNALKFTDSRSRFQFYHLTHLHRHIQAALDNGLRTVNLATAPVQADELHAHIFGTDFQNFGTAQPLHYDIQSEHAEVLGGRNGYLQDKPEILDQIKRFVLDGIAALGRSTR